jgi:hypothetical protein
MECKIVVFAPPTARAASTIVKFVISVYYCKPRGTDDNRVLIKCKGKLSSYICGHRRKVEQDVGMLLFILSTIHILYAWSNSLGKNINSHLIIYHNYIDSHTLDRKIDN